jgi:hypothetical protein
MSWQELERELDRWSADGRTATLWWRDDDAVTETPALRRLLALRESVGVPLGLAVIPESADEALAACLTGEVAVLQHGWAHRNHGPAGEAKIELGGRPATEVAIELRRGWTRLSGLFADRLLPVVVPPWNRITAEVRESLPTLGYRGISTFKPRQKSRLIETNTHVDIIDWSGTRGFGGEARALDNVIAHLTQRRSGAADPDEPSGLLTHHLVHDEGCWRFVHDFLTHTRSHAAARWVSPRDIFAA